MKLFTIHSESHGDLFWDYFVPSLKGQFDLCGERTVQTCPTGEYKSEGWRSVSQHKVEALRDLCKKETEPFVYSDVDVLFHDFTQEDAIRGLGDSELACMDDGGGVFCAGFMIIRPGPSTAALFDIVLTMLEECDQPVMNYALKFHPIAILLPQLWYSNYNTLGAPEWSTEGLDRLARISPEAKVFHANWIVGVNKKREALDAVRRIWDKHDRTCNLVGKGVKAPL